MQEKEKCKPESTETMEPSKGYMNLSTKKKTNIKKDLKYQQEFYSLTDTLCPNGHDFCL